MGRGGFVYADADHRASGRTRAKRRAADLEFLLLVMTLREMRDVDALQVLLRNHSHAPEWKQVAIQRALKEAVMAPPKRSEQR